MSSRKLRISLKSQGRRLRGRPIKGKAALSCVKPPRLRRYARPDEPPASPSRLIPRASHSHGGISLPSLSRGRSSAGRGLRGHRYHIIKPAMTKHSATTTHPHQGSSVASRACETGWVRKLSVSGVAKVSNGLDISGLFPTLPSALTAYQFRKMNVHADRRNQ